jgi:hypothetical protein
MNTKKQTEYDNDFVEDKADEDCDFKAGPPKYAGIKGFWYYHIFPFFQERLIIPLFYTISIRLYKVIIMHLVYITVISILAAALAKMIRT